MRFTFATAALTAALAAQIPDDSWAADFDTPGIGFDSEAYAVATFGGDLIVGARFPMLVDGQVLQHIARFDGSRWRPLGAGFNSIVRALAVYNGELHAAGLFTVSGSRQVAGVARWDGTAWQPLGQGIQVSYGVEGRVYGMAVWNGELYVTGEFDRAGGLPADNIARWNGTTWRAVGSGIANPAAGYALLPTTSRLIVGGAFQSAGGTASPMIAAWNGSQWSAMGAGFYSDVRALVEFNGQIHAGGLFGASGSTICEGIARWNGTGWGPVAGGVLGGVYALAVQGNSLFAGGSFYQVDNGNGLIAADDIARWDGNNWSGIGGVQASGNPIFRKINGTTVWRDRLVVAGDFGTAGFVVAPGQQVATNCVASFDGSRWGAISTGRGMTGDVLALLRWRGDVIAAGHFLRAGEEYSTQLARHDGNDWHTLGNFNGPVFDAVEFQGDLVVTGQFTSIDGIVCNRIARFDGVTWSPLGGGAGEYAVAVFQNQLYAGGIGTPRRWNGSSWQPVTAIIGGSISTMVEYQGRLYFGGSLGQFGGPGPYLVAFDGQQTLQVGTPPNRAVHALAVHAGELWIGGEFTTAGGQPAQHVAIWNGTNYRPAGAGLPGPTGISVNTFATLGNELYAGGTFATETVPPGPANRLARWTGSAWLPVGSGANGAIGALLADETAGQLWAGGRFFLAGGKPASNLTVWSAEPRWTDLGHGEVGATPVQLDVRGLPRASATMTFALTRAPASTPAALVLGFGQSFLPVLGVTLVPSPDFLQFLQCDPAGAASFALLAPPVLAPGPELFAQVLVLDGTQPQGLAATRATAARIR